MKAIYDVPAPAKLNLFLHITGRRPDGYHLLQSVFMLIDWCDTLHFELRHDGRIERTDLTEPLPADDLAVRAARLLQQAGQVQEGAHISIERLCELAIRLGADVPFFIRGRNAWVEGIGEIIHPLENSAQCPPARFIVVKPQAGLETAKIFSSPLLEWSKNAATIEGFA